MRIICYLALIYLTLIILCSLVTDALRALKFYLITLEV